MKSCIRTELVAGDHSWYTKQHDMFQDGIRGECLVLSRPPVFFLSAGAPRFEMTKSFKANTAATIHYKNVKRCMNIHTLHSPTVFVWVFPYESGDGMRSAPFFLVLSIDPFPLLANHLLSRLLFVQRDHPTPLLCVGRYKLGMIGTRQHGGGFRLGL